MSDSIGDKAKRKRLDNRRKRLEACFAKDECNSSEVQDHDELNYETEVLDRLSPQAQLALLRTRKSSVEPLSATPRPQAGPPLELVEVISVPPPPKAGRPFELDDVISAFEKMRKERIKLKDIRTRLKKDYGIQYASERSMAESIRRAKKRRSTQKPT